MASAIHPDMSVREIVAQASRDLEEQLGDIGPPRPSPAAAPAPAQEAVAVNRNPLTPEDDVEQAYEWRAVPIVNDGKAMVDDMRNLSELSFFEYASTTGDRLINGLTATQRGLVHLYRRKKRAGFRQDTDTMATLLYQRKMLEHKKEIDDNSVAIAEHHRANPDTGW